MINNGKKKKLKTEYARAKQDHKMKLCILKKICSEGLMRWSTNGKRKKKRSLRS